MLPARERKSGYFWKVMQKLPAGQIDQFISQGFVKIENAFPAGLADECRAILWKATGCNPDHPETWTQPVLRIGEFALPKAVTAALDLALETGRLTLRGYDRTLRLAWTHADLAGRGRPTAEDVGVALMLRTLPPKMKRLPVSWPMTRTISARSASSRENETL